MQIIRLKPSDKTIEFNKNSDVLIICDATNNSFTVALPDPNRFINYYPKIFVVKDDSTAYTVTVSGKINGTITQSIVLRNQYDQAEFLTDGIKYYYNTGLNGSLQITQGVSTPAAISGKLILFSDSGDGNQVNVLTPEGTLKRILLEART